jgi:hypothetical protein
MSRSFNVRPLVTPLLVRALFAVALPLAGCSTNAATEDPAGTSKADLAGFDEVVYVSRQNYDGKTPVVADGMGQVMDYGRYVPGARLEVRNLRNNEVRNLLDGSRFAKADVREWT